MRKITQLRLRSEHAARGIVESAARRDSEEGRKLKEYLNAWFDSGYSLLKMLDTLEEVRRHLPNLELTLAVKAEGKPALHSMLPVDSDLMGYAAWSFARFLDSSHSEHLGRCDRCGHLYLQTTKRKNKRYCDRRCANAASVARDRQRLQKKKREKVMAAYRDLTKLSSKPKDKKKWVAMESGVDQRWITRNLRAGKLPPIP